MSEKQQAEQKGFQENISASGEAQLAENPQNHKIQLLSVIGEIEGHECLAANTKTTKYEHVLPQLAQIEDSCNVDGLLILLNTVGGDVESGLAIAEMIASLSKPTVSLVLGGQAEPADAARLYGELHGAVWTGMPVMERLLVIPRPHIHLDVDFAEEKTNVQGTVGLSARIGTLLRIGMTVAIPGLRWLLAYMKNKQAPVGKDESDGNGKEQPAA